MMLSLGTRLSFANSSERKAFVRLMPERCFEQTKDGSVILTCATELQIFGGKDDRVIQFKPEPPARPSIF